MRLEDVTMRFGAFTALSDLSFDVKKGEILGVAGPNGAGKSTLLNVCSGGLRSTSGKVLFKERDITRLKRHACCLLGIGRTFQIPTVLSSLTVAENVLAGATFGRHNRGAPDERTGLKNVLQLTGLTETIDMNAGAADLLTRKRIMLAATLATKPEIIFMDEPLGGLNAEEIDSFCDAIKHIHRELGMTFVIVEHKTRALAKLSDRILILNFGERICLDVPHVVMNDERVIDIYLGKKQSA